MSIKNPTTYAEWYWAQQLDATKEYDEQTEAVLSPLIVSLQSTLAGMDDVPPGVNELLSAFATPGAFGLAAVGTAVAGQAVSGTVAEGLSPFLRGLSYSINNAKPNRLIELDNAATLLFRGQLLHEDYLTLARRYGYDEPVADAIYQSLRPYPNVLDILSYVRFFNDDISTYEKTFLLSAIPTYDFPIWDFLSRIRLSPGDIQSLYVRKNMTAEQARTELIRRGYTPDAIPSTLNLSYQIPNSAILLQSSLFREEPFDVNENYVSIGGIHPDYAPHFIDGLLTKPDPETIIRYLRRIDPNLSSLDRELKRIGVHPDYFTVFRTLSYPVPPVADLITMAVREAFSPAIAARFGQYEDYPSDLTQFAAMNGISEEWARRYWAAHWNLPSTQQGFEMLHRGVIDASDLNLLLRALDVMPFWRDKLIQISYNPLTRVDVRRMYALGVLTADEVEKAYRDIGYTSENAGRLREFTIRQAIASQSGLSVSKIVTAYKNGYTTRSDAYTAIQRLGVREANISEILESADLQLRWQRTKESIGAIRNQFKQELMDEQIARSELASLGIDPVKVDTLLHTWITDGEKERGTLLSKTDVLTLLKKGLITRERSTTELRLLGYTTERVNLLLSSIA